MDISGDISTVMLSLICLSLKSICYRNISYINFISSCQVSMLLKQFMMEHVTPELQTDSKGKSAFIKEPLKAALIMLYVWRQYYLKLENGALSRLCTALCLPKLPKDEFLSFWTDLTESFSEIKK